jgi:hypothetical protein
MGHRGRRPSQGKERTSPVAAKQTLKPFATIVSEWFGMKTPTDRQLAASIPACLAGEQKTQRTVSPKWRFQEENRESKRPHE